jgi:hypothetical protein
MLPPTQQADKSQTAAVAKSQLDNEMDKDREQPPEDTGPRTVARWRESLERDGGVLVDTAPLVPHGGSAGGGGGDGGSSEDKEWQPGGGGGGSGGGGAGPGTTDLQESLPRAKDIRAEWIRTQSQRLIDCCLNLRCPRCEQVVVMLDDEGDGGGGGGGGGVFSHDYSCGAVCCALCLKIYPTRKEARAHIPTCPLNPTGAANPTAAVRDAAHRTLRLDALRAALSQPQCRTLAGRLAAHLRRPLEDLGIEPEEVLPEGAVLEEEEEAEEDSSSAAAADQGQQQQQAEGGGAVIASSSLGAAATDQDEYARSLIWEQVALLGDGHGGGSQDQGSVKDGELAAALERAAVIEAVRAADEAEAEAASQIPRIRGGSLLWRAAAAETLEPARVEVHNAANTVTGTAPAEGARQVHEQAAAPRQLQTADLIIPPAPFRPGPSLRPLREERREEEQAAVREGLAARGVGLILRERDQGPDSKP